VEDRSRKEERIQGEFDIDIAGVGHINHLHEWFAPTEGILLDTSVPIVEGVISGKHLFGDKGHSYNDGTRNWEP